MVETFVGWRRWSLKRAVPTAEGTVRSDSGSVLPLVAVWLAVVVVMAMMIVAVSGAAAGRARAQAAADAVALAGAGGGRDAAVAVAGANAATIDEYVEQPVAGLMGNQPGSPGRSAQSLMVVTVVIDVDGVTATAAAERFLTPVGFPSGS